MAARRLEPVEPVTLRVDGAEVPARAGEPIAMSLLAAGRLVLGRSVKYHRPRGATCFSGRCDGCLMRVDGVPSVRTCRTAAAHGMELSTQNVVGSAELDLLSAADWFFPGGMNHHEMFTWAKPVNQVMQLVAREVAGIGTLPDAAASRGTMESREPDVLVVGAGAAGLAASRLLSQHGLRVLCVDEEQEAGGQLRWAGLDRGAEADGRTSALRLTDAARRAGVEVLLGHVALGLFDEPDEGRIALLDGPSGLVRVRARAWVLATGRTEGAAAFAGNDLPGVIGAEAAARILSHGILPGERVVLAGDLEARETELVGLARTLARHGASVSGPHPLRAIVRADGRTQVSSVTIERDGSRTKVPCDLAIVAPRTSATYELAVQAGARTELRDGVFEILHVPGAHGTWIVGALAGAPSLADAIADAERAAEEIIAALGAPAPREGVAR
jgi:sarcosine oxidase subunit alpha